jgi:hypothetical protein
MLLMMNFYAGINYLQSFQAEFIYYSLYACFLGLLFFLYALHGRASTGFNYFLESYFDLTLQLTAHFFYCLFLQKFLESKERFTAVAPIAQIFASPDRSRNDFIQLCILQ